MSGPFIFLVHLPPLDAHLVHHDTIRHQSLEAFFPASLAHVVLKAYCLSTVSMIFRSGLSLSHLLLACAVSGVKSAKSGPRCTQRSGGWDTMA